MREEDRETIYGVSSEKLAYEGKQRKEIAGKGAAIKGRLCFGFKNRRQ